jgi:hypothetical protein
MLALTIALTATMGAGKVLFVPAHCVNVDKFYGVCKPSQYEGFDCHVHMKVKPDRDCNMYNTRDVLQVNP